METMRSVTRSRLNALLVQPDETPVGTPELPAFPTTPPALDSLLRLAETNRPMIRAGERDVEAASASEQLARRDIWPDLQVGAQLGGQSGPDGRQRMGSIMFGVSLPLYAEHRQYAMRDETAAMREMAAADLAGMRAETRGAVAVAYANVTRSRRLAAFYRGSVLPQAEATVSSSLAAYRAGTVNFTTLLDAQMSVNKFRQELFTLEAEEGSAWAELEMLTGHVLVDLQSGGTSR
jgi:outer membrane protein TolC